MIRMEPFNVVGRDGETRPGGLLTCGCGVTQFHVYLAPVVPEGMHVHYQCPECHQTFCAEGCTPDPLDMDHENPFHFKPETN